MRLAALLLAILAGPAAGEEIAAARFIGPTTHYDHGILGDAVEYSALQITTRDGRRFRVSFSEGGRVFEDIAPRLWDVTGDGKPEVVVVETDPPQGAQLAIYGLKDGRVAKIAATPHIGQTHRWLAPVGTADLDGDGQIEIAYVDRPHLAKVLRLWRYENGSLKEVAGARGMTNHRIGWDFIAGGIRDCGGRAEMILASADWRDVLAVRWDGTRFRAARLGAYRGPTSLSDAVSCK